MSQRDPTTIAELIASKAHAPYPAGIEAAKKIQHSADTMEWLLNFFSERGVNQVIDASSSGNRDGHGLFVQDAESSRFWKITTTDDVKVVASPFTNLPLDLAALNKILIAEVSLVSLPNYTMPVEERRVFEDAPRANVSAHLVVEHLKATVGELWLHLDDQQTQNAGLLGPAGYFPETFDFHLPISLDYGTISLADGVEDGQLPAILQAAWQSEHGQLAARYYEEQRDQGVPFLRPEQVMQFMAEHCPDRNLGSSDHLRDGWDLV